MAEPKDYVGILSQEQNIWIGDTPQETLQNAKRRLIELGAKPGTPEYEFAFMNTINRLAMGAGAPFSAGGMVLTPSTAGKEALDYLNKNMDVKQIKEELDIDPLNWRIGKDVNQSWRSEAGELIGGNDIYQRSNTGEKEVDPKTGLPLYSAVAPFATITTGTDVAGMLKLEDLDIVPESAFWYLRPEFNKRLDEKGNVESYQRDIAQELLDIGFVPGAKVTPELATKYRQYQLSRMSPELRAQVTSMSSPTGTNASIAGTGSTTNSLVGTGSSNMINEPGTPGYNPNKPTTNTDVLKSALRGLGFTSAILDSSTSFLTGLLREGLDYDNATEIFLNNKEYTLKNGSKITSPFYTEYGYLNEGLVVPKSAGDLFNTVEGYKGVLDKYKLSPKYLTKDSLQKYVKNDITVKDLSERAASAELRALEADQFQVNALVKLGYIGSATDLKDFYMDSKIGQEQLELNRQTGVFTAEALRRAKSGVLSSDNQLSQFKQLTASLAAKGYSEAQISQLAGTGFENIAEAINPMTKFAQVYDKAGGTVESNAALTESLQTELLSEEFKGTASEKRKRYSELERSAFQGSSGRANVRPSSVAGIL